MSNVVLLVIGPTLIVLLIYKCFSLFSGDNKEEKLELARCKYQGALDELAQENSSDNKIKALELGRHYASLSRELHHGDKSVTIFDEVALTNDINVRLNS